MATMDLEKKFAENLSLEEKGSNDLLLLKKKMLSESPPPALSVINTSTPVYIPTKNYIFDSNTNIGKFFMIRKFQFSWNS